MYYINNTKEKEIILQVVDLLLDEGDESLIVQTEEQLEKQIFDFTGKMVNIDESLLTFYLSFFYEDETDDYEDYEDEEPSYEKIYHNHKKGGNKNEDK